jgi:glutathione S-transferase
MEMLDKHLELTGAYVVGNRFSLAGIPIGLSVIRWSETPLDHPHFPAVSDYYERLSQRQSYRLYGRNGAP